MFIMNPSGMGEDQGYTGHPEIDPGSMGQMDVGYGSYGSPGYETDSFDEEQPLLKELGIDFELIKQKVTIGNVKRVYNKVCFVLDSVCA